MVTRTPILYHNILTPMTKIFEGDILPSMEIREFNEKIEMSTGGQTSLFFLGTGGAFSKKNFQNNVLVIKGNDHILIDCGLLCPFSFASFNSSISDVQNLLITHAHGDHIGGLEEIALSGMYMKHQKPNIIIEDCFKKSLWNNSLKGACGRRCEPGMNPKVTFDDYFTQIKPKKIKGAPRPFFETNIGSINLKLFRTKHIFTKKDSWKSAFYSVGALIDSRIIFTSDSVYDPELLEWLCSSFDIEYIFHDCQFGTNAVHASYDELKTLDPSIKAKMILCHYNDGKEDFDVSKDGFFSLAKRGVYYDF